MRQTTMWLLAAGLAIALLFTVGADSAEKTKKQKRQEKKAKQAEQAVAEKQAAPCEACQPQATLRGHGHSDPRRCFQFVTADYGSYCSYASLTCGQSPEWREDNWMPPWSALPGNCPGEGDPNCIGTEWKYEGKPPGDEPLPEKLVPQFGMAGVPGATATITHVRYIQLKKVKNKQDKDTKRTIKLMRIEHKFKHDGKDVSLESIQAWEVSDQPEKFDEIIQTHNQNKYRIKFEHKMEIGNAEKNVKVDVVLREHPIVP